MLCKNCGNQLAGDVRVCPKCGVEIGGGTTSSAGKSPSPSTDDSGSLVSRVTGLLKPAVVAPDGRNRGSRCGVGKESEGLYIAGALPREFGSS